MRAWLCTRLLTDGHGAVKDIQQALEFRGGTVAKKWRQTGRSQGAIRRRDKRRRGRTSRRRTVGHRGRAGKPLSTRRGAIKWRQTRRDINAIQSQHKGRRRAPNGDKRDEEHPCGEPQGTVAKQRGRTERGACGDLPLSSLEGDVGLARPVGVDSYAGDTGATGTGVSKEGP